MTHPMQREVYEQVAKMADLALQQAAEVDKKIAVLKQDQDRIKAAAHVLQQARNILAPQEAEVFEDETYGRYEQAERSRGDL